MSTKHEKKHYDVTLCGPAIAANQRIDDNFLESETFFRGSVIRAGFARQIAYACPLSAEERSRGGGMFVIEQKSETGCAGCRYAEICRRFSEMRFSYAYPADAVPVPFTARCCKKMEDAHPIQDILIPSEDPQIACCACPPGEGRMESLGGYVRRDVNGAWRSVGVARHLSTHTSILSKTQTVRESTLFSIYAVAGGQHYQMTLDDCGTGLAEAFDTVYIGKYAASGYGRIRLTEREAPPAVPIGERIAAFQARAKDSSLLSVLLLSDVRLPVPADRKVLLGEWEQLLFGDSALPFRLEKIYTETTLYSGYNTARPWGEWRDPVPDLLMKTGTSLLLRICEGQREAAVSLLEALEESGIGQRCCDGYGAIAVCHPLHAIGRGT